MNSTSRFTINNKFLLLALDHKGILKEAIQHHTQREATHEQLVELKRQIIEATYDHCSGILVDVELGLPAYRQHLQQNPHKEAKPYILRLEKSPKIDGEKINELQHSVRDLKALGTNAAKLLLYFNPSTETARHQIELAKRVLRDCKKEGMHFILEPVMYFRDPRTEQLPSLMVRSLRTLLDHGIRPDVFKIEYPGSPEACAQVTTMLGKTPWILLSGGKKFETFKDDFKSATAQGSLGAVVGRSIWQDFHVLPPDQWANFFQTISRERFIEMAKAAAASAI